MDSARRFVSTLIFLFTSVSLFCQSVSDAAVQLSASVNSVVPQITLTWPAASSATQHQVFRKLKPALSWGSAIATLPGNATQYADQAVLVGENYEYRVIRSGSNYAGYGYINSGIGIPETDYRGKLLLIVDSTFISSLSAEIGRLTEDIRGDGWDVIRYDVDRSASVNHVKQLIISEYMLDQVNVKAVFLLGHVPVPYSGNIAPDGHTNHVGAWPADCYYADVNGNWTDVSVTSTTNSPARTQNIPGDGKFDQSAIPSPVELQVGRVDMSNLPAFSQSEYQLLKNYLDKNHEYRKKIYIPVKRAVYDDNFGYFGSEAFAASGLKNFGPLVGSGNVTSGDYFTSMTAGSYLWSYGCGGGSYTSASGVGNTTGLSTASLQGVFTMLFGSYFGDWDSQNNFLRASLAQGRMLTVVWSGRPHYQLHHMGLGENIGYGIALTQNFSGSLYFASPTGIHGGYVHNALMGDPTLRNDVVAPVAGLVALRQGYDINVSWTASPDTGIIGYHLYRKFAADTAFTRVNSTPLTGTTFTDACAAAGSYTYMVRALKLETTASGSYFNLSEGITDTAQSNGHDVIAQFSTSINGNSVTLTSNSVNADGHIWTSGATQYTSSGAVFTYTNNGLKTIRLLSYNKCGIDSASTTVNICYFRPSSQFSADVSGDTVYFSSSSISTTKLLWIFGNGDTSSLAGPVVHYSAPGNYTVTLISFNECFSDTITQQITIIDVGLWEYAARHINIYPNPANDIIMIEAENITGVQLFSAEGRLIMRAGGEDRLRISQVPEGIYILRILSRDGTITRKIAIRH